MVQNGNSAKIQIRSFNHFYSINKEVNNVSVNVQPCAVLSKSEMLSVLQDLLFEG